MVAYAIARNRFMSQLPLQAQQNRYALTVGAHSRSHQRNVGPNQFTDEQEATVVELFSSDPRTCGSRYECELDSWTLI